MGERVLKLKKLRKILRKYGVEEDSSRGKGSHTLFTKEIDGELYSYPVPTAKKDILPCYVAGCRKAFQLRHEDGVSDSDFYGD